MAPRRRVRTRQRGPEISVEALVEPAARRHGDYRVEQLAVTTGELGPHPAGNVRVVRNRGGTAVERWQANGSLTLAQVEAIAVYCRAYRLRFGMQRVVANWSLVASIRGGGESIETFTATVLAAKALLQHLDDAIFFALPLHYLEVWQNVVLHDEATGTAGARLGFRSKQAEAAAKATVKLIADMIATDLRLGVRPV